MGHKRVRKEKSKRKAWFCFFKRAAILLFMVLVAAGLLAIVGWEAVSALGIVKESVTALADAAADAFGDAE